MPKVPAGEVRWTAEGPVARVTLLGKKRASLLMSACKTADEANTRSKLLAGLAQRFRKAGVIEKPEAMTLLETAATCGEALLPGVMTVAGELIGGTLPETLAKVPTFRQVAAEWTSGALHKRFPDHVKAKDSEIDEKRLAHLCELPVGAGKLGDLLCSRFKVEHAELAMQNLPESAKRPATRRQYAQLLHRVLGLAVYPCRYIATHPLPKGFLPKIGKPPAFTYLRPAEDERLMAHTALPLCYRVLFGFLAREGCRKGEAIGLQVRDFDLELGTVRLDKNKTDDPRPWALDRGVTEALRAWVAQRGAGPDAYMFVDEAGEVLTEEHRLSDVLRAALLAAGVDRDDIHHDGPNRLKLRVHDLRGTFVTLNLAAGKTETWVADRTGHTSSQMINRYRRKARQASELGLGELLPMSQAIPELCQRRPTRAEWQPEANALALGSDALPPHCPADGTPEGIRTPDRWIRNPLLYPAELRARGSCLPSLGSAEIRTGFFAGRGAERSSRFWL